MEALDVNEMFRKISSSAQYKINSELEESPLSIQDDIIAKKGLSFIPSFLSFYSHLKNNFKKEVNKYIFNGLQ